MNLGVPHPPLGAAAGLQVWLVAPVTKILLARGLCDAESLERGLAVLEQSAPPGPLSRQRLEEACAAARLGAQR